MIRKKVTGKRIPDLINRSASKDFTQIPNKLLRNPTLSYKAKGILCLLLSNRTGWNSYREALVNTSVDGLNSVNSGLKELEKARYLRIHRYRDRKTKMIVGSFWSYADIPGDFGMGKIDQLLTEKGMERVPPGAEKQTIQSPEIPYMEIPHEEIPYMEIPHEEIPPMENPLLKIYKDKKTKKKISLAFSEKVNKQCQELALKLLEIIKTKKNIKLPPTAIPSWTREIEKLVERNEIAPGRIETALDWYAEHINDPYCPVIESGATLREKFIRLEAAVERSKEAPKKESRVKIGTGYSGRYDKLKVKEDR